MTVVVYIMFRVSCVVVPVQGGTVFCLSVVCSGWRYNHVLGTSTKPLHITKRCLQAQSVTTQNNATRPLRSDLPLTPPPPAQQTMQNDPPIFLLCNKLLNFSSEVRCISLTPGKFLSVQVVKTAPYTGYRKCYTVINRW